MSEAAVLVVSPHADFAQTVAEQVKAELGLACALAGDFSGAEAAALVVTTEDAPQSLSCPVVAVRKGPVRMVSLLEQIRQAREQQGEDVVLARGYLLKARPKQLQRGQAVIELTDKEVAIIQCLHAAGAEGVGREQLLKKVWGFDSSLDTHTLETHIYRLRNKIRESLRGSSDDEALINATPGGYALVMK